MDAVEFKQRVIPISGKLLHYALQILHDSHEAEDAVQETILKLWKMKDTLHNYTSLEAFSMKITRNWCLDRLKAKKPLYVEGYQAGYDRQTDEANPHRQLEQADRLELLERLLEKLPEQQKQILQLRDMEGLEFEQIAIIMGMNLNALRVNLSRARNRLRDEIVKYEGYGYQTDKDIAGKIL